MTDVPAYDGPALTPFQAYKARMLPWGESCAKWESYLAAHRLRPLWRELAVKLRKDGMEYYEACYQSHLAHSPERCEELLDQMPLSDDDEKFVEECKAGLRLNLPLRAGIEKELDWISGNINQPLPSLTTCPSLSAISFIMDARVSKKVRENFWATCWSKRMSPGDSKSKKQSSVKEDGDTDVESENHESALRARLFGGE
jgi:hypothetical protein